MLQPENGETKIETRTERGEEDWNGETARRTEGWTESRGETPILPHEAAADPTSFQGESTDPGLSPHGLPGLPLTMPTDRGGA